MRVSDAVLKAIAAAGVSRDNGLGHLLPLYFDCRPGYVPRHIAEALVSSGIYSEGEGRVVTWHVPLFEGLPGDDGFGWVKSEYFEMFRRASPERALYATEALRRMKRFFAENPDVRKEEVLAATEMYLSRTSPSYVMFPNYFIRKGSGADLQEALLHWIGEHRSERERSVASRSERRLLL